MNDSELNAVTLLYLSKSWDGGNSLLDCAHKFQQTKEALATALTEEAQKQMERKIESGSIL